MLFPETFGSLLFRGKTGLYVTVKPMTSIMLTSKETAVMKFNLSKPLICYHSSVALTIYKNIIRKIFYKLIYGSVA